MTDPLTDARRSYLIGTVNEMASDLNAMLRLPRIDEEAWSERFRELPYPDGPFRVRRRRS
jgi:hypothetical protein